MGHTRNLNKPFFCQLRTVDLFTVMRLAPVSCLCACVLFVRLVRSLLLAVRLDERWEGKAFDHIACQRCFYFDASDSSTMLYLIGLLRPCCCPCPPPRKELIPMLQV